MKGERTAPIVKNLHTQLARWAALRHYTFRTGLGPLATIDVVWGVGFCWQGTPSFRVKDISRVSGKNPKRESAKKGV